jgi:signal transduction histidine kinase
LWGGSETKLVQKAARMSSWVTNLKRASPFHLTGTIRLVKFGVPLGFALIAAPVFLIIGLLVLRAEQDGATNALVRATEVQNAGIARTLANAHSDPISYLLALDIGDAPELLPIALRRSGLQPLIEASLHDTNVVNVKIYDGQGVTLFSLEQSELGEDISACECFAMVMADGTYSELQHWSDGAEGHPHGDSAIDLLSTMIKLSVLTPHLVASDSVLEVQSDVTGLIAPIIATRHETSLVVGLPLVILYLLMVALVTFGHATIVRRDRQAAAFAARAAESEASDQAKSEFLSLMSHELRTPLNAIVGFAHLISDGSRNADDNETADWADAIHDSGLHMTRVVSSILDMTALELGEFELDREVVHLRDIVRAAVTTVQPAFDKGLVTLSVHENERQTPVSGDRQKLKLVFENLLSNAARFTPAGGTVDITLDETPAGFASVTIRDTGVGMTKDQIQQARLPFHANWSGLSREADGAGLGLTIADRIVENLGGSLIIESEADAGTSITVCLPVCRSDGANITEVSPPEHGPANMTSMRTAIR